MGGVGDKIHRSSSPLKRPASELEEDPTILGNGDVDMVNAPEGSSNMSAKRSNNSPPPAAITNMGTKNDNKRTNDVDDNDDDDGMEFWEESAPATAMPETNEKAAPQNIDSKKVDAPDDDAPPPPPPIDEQIRIISLLVGEFEAESLKEGTRTYVVSNKWVDRVKAHGTGAKVSTEVAESSIGPVDNSDIIWEVILDQNQQYFARLNPDAVDHIKFFPEKAWNLVTAWYGLKEGQPAIVRTAVDTSLSSEPNIQFETHPVVLRIHRLWAATSPIPIDQLTKAQKPAPKNWVVSRNDKVKPFLENIKRATGVKSDCAVKMWTVPEVLQKLGAAEGSATPSRANTPAPEQIDWSQMLIDANAFVTLPLGPMGREKVDHDDPCGNPGGSTSTMDMKGLSQDCRIVLDENVEGRIYLSTFVKSVKNGSKNAALSATAKGASSALTKTTDSGISSPAPAPPAISMSLRGRPSGKTIGCVGLSNLGNTCYMNSALQCIRSVEELTKYFLDGAASEEINYENPLGKNGQIAIVYNDLLKEMYKSPCPGAFTPRRFKGTIGRYFPNFSGYGQQDSQEFLGLLLDALQEDLNRIKKKPYIEKPDSTDEMVNDPEALKKMAEQVWGITKARDDSVISDLFTGMYKSTLVCPECDKVSITFDPFNTVTVQIPIESTWTHTIHYFPLNGKPFKIDIDMDKNGSFKKLKQFISSRVGVPTARLFIAEEWKGSIYRYFEDSKTASEEITNGDIILVYELDMVPTNWPPVKKQKKVRSMLNINDSEDDVPEGDAPEAERMVVPVFYRRKGSQPRYGKARAWEQALVPMMIMLTKEDARRPEVIRRKVLQRVQNLTTWEIRPDGEDSASPSEADEESTDQDMVVTTASDASSGDRNIAANSVSGDEELVDITMKDPSAPSSPESSQTNKPKLPGQTAAPRWLDPSVPLTLYERCFNIAVWKDDKHLLPHGINAISLDRDYPSILDRLSKPVLEDIIEVEEPATSAAEDADAISSPVTEEDSDVAQLGEGVTRMNDESSEDDDLAVKKTLPLRTRKSPNVGSISANPVHRIVKRPLKTYSRKKANDKSATISHHFGGDGTNDSEDEVEQEPLIRLGEALIVDWDEEAISIMFGGEEGQGLETWAQCPTLEDPQLMAKQAHRSRRKKDGVSLSECLDEFGKEEILGDNDMWYCNRCKIHRHASKKLELWKTPDILVLHFKRFSSTSHRRDKLDVRIDFPIEGLDMTKRIVESDGKEEVYDLFAVDNHYGSLGGGHYTACAKSFVDGEWYDYNDSSVSKIRDTDNLISSAAYLLFYRRRSKKPLGGPKLEEIVQRMKRQEEEGDEEGENDREDDQGNGQRLGVDSPSRNGSSSASQGVGATVPVSQRGGLLSPTTSPPATSLLGGLSGGTGRVLGTAMGRNNIPSGLDLTSPSDPKVNTEHIENLPDYKEAVAYGPEVPPSFRDAQLNEGIQLSNNDGEFEDEAIDMGDAFNNASFSPGGGLRAYAPSQSWGFSGLGVGEGGAKTSLYGEDGDASDLVSDGVENGSDASSGRRAERFEDFENAEVDEDYEEASYVPDLDDSGAAGSVDLVDLSDDIVNQKLARVSRATPGGIGAYEDNLELEVPMEGKEEYEPGAMEIHVEAGEGLGKL